jgi:hypothetical protein
MFCSPLFQPFAPSKTTTVSENNRNLAAFVVGRAINKQLGAEPNMAFSLVEGHRHCRFPNVTTASLDSLPKAFLLGHGSRGDVFGRSASVV